MKSKGLFIKLNSSFIIKRYIDFFFIIAYNLVNPTSKIKQNNHFRDKVAGENLDEKLWDTCEELFAKNSR